MSLAQGNNTPTRPRIEPGSPDPESDALTTRPERPPSTDLILIFRIASISDNLGFSSICLLLILVVVWFLFGEVSSSSGYLGWAALLYCGTP